MKPTGLTIDFKIVRPTPTEDKIWDAVEAALCANWTPEQFIREVRQAWEYELQERIKDANKEFTKCQLSKTT